MRKALIIASLLVGTPALAEEVAAEPTGKIVLYRGGGIVGAAISCPVRYQGNEIVELGRSKFAEWNVAPGRYILTNKTASVEVHVAPGETRYVRCRIKSGFVSGLADLQIVDKESYEGTRGLERKGISQ